MRQSTFLALVSLIALVAVGWIFSATADRSSLEAQEEAVRLHAQEAEAETLLSEEQQRSRAIAAYEFAADLPATDPARRLLAFTEAFNLATELALPDSFSLPVQSLANLAPDPESIFSDPTFQSNLGEMVTEGGRVLGGVETGDHPDCVAVGGPSGWCCTGTLIAPDRVVTAGHCYESCASRVFVGPSITEPGEVIQVRQAIRHPSYKTQGHHDLTVLELDRPVSGVSPATLATAEAIEAASFVRIVGYGTTNAYGTLGYGKRRMVDVPIASVNCRPDDVGKKYGCDTGLELVAGAPFLDRDSCNGDSGGPAYVEVQGRWLLAGATSRATKNSLRPCGDGGVYVRLDQYSDWIGF